MRITKKFAGAACLGRSSYRYRNRPHPTGPEIHLARAQLDELENRFRKRVEMGYLPLTPTTTTTATLDGMMLMAVAQSQLGQNTIVPHPNAAAAVIQSWLMGMAGAAAQSPVFSQLPAATTTPGCVAMGPWPLLPNIQSSPALLL
jgi:hypothetical protein